MKKIIITIIISLLFYSCIEDSTNESYVIDNKSSVDVNMLSYTNGLMVNATTINAKTSVLYSSDNNRGKGQPRLFFPEFGVDSILIIFNGQYEVLHMLNDTFYTGSRKTLDSNSDRSFCQIKSYDITTKKKTRNRIEYEIRYTFTEADYEFAKQ